MWYTCDVNKRRDEPNANAYTNDAVLFIWFIFCFYFVFNYWFYRVLLWSTEIIFYEKVFKRLFYVVLGIVLLVAFQLSYVH